MLSTITLALLAALLAVGFCFVGYRCTLRRAGFSWRWRAGAKTCRSASRTRPNSTSSWENRWKSPTNLFRLPG
jgi:hypothetical protein